MCEAWLDAFRPDRAEVAGARQDNRGGDGIGGVAGVVATGSRWKNSDALGDAHSPARMPRLTSSWMNPLNASGPPVTSRPSPPTAPNDQRSGDDPRDVAAIPQRIDQEELQQTDDEGGEADALPRPPGQSGVFQRRRARRRDEQDHAAQTDEEGVDAEDPRRESHAAGWSHAPVRIHAPERSDG